jgi:hypothetical protein
MSENRTTSILQRVPVILAVTAASYGLNVQAQVQRPDRGERSQHTVSAKSDEGTNALERMREAIASQD